MENLNRYVTANGMLKDSLVLNREKLYKGMNGKFVERFYLSPTESFIFKPLTNEPQFGKEYWVYEHILSSFPPIFPKMLAKSTTNDPTKSWMVFEDLGSLLHEFDECTALEVTKMMAWWQSLPTNQLLDAPLTGPKPMIEEIAQTLFIKKEEIQRAAKLLDIPLPLQLIKRIYDLLVTESFSQQKVLSHGDLHLGNYTVVKGKLIILDWEHAHLNSPFWDLYHLIDMSHPVFPKTVNSKLREKILKEYIYQSSLNGIQINVELFKHGYYLFSAVFSLWMILLIMGDLDRKDEKWTEQQLRNQLKETISSFLQCAENV